MAKKDSTSISLVIVDENELSVKVTVNDETFNVLQADILAIKAEIRKTIHDCKQQGEKFEFKVLRDEKIRQRIGNNEKDHLLFLALQSLLSKSFSRRARAAVVSNRKSKAKKEIMEKVAKEAAIPLQSSKQESLFGDDTSMLSRKAYREDLHLNSLGKKKRAKKRP